MQRILGHTGVGGERGRIINPKSYMTSLSATDWKDPPKTVKNIGVKKTCLKLNKPQKTDGLILTVE